MHLHRVCSPLTTGQRTTDLQPTDHFAHGHPRPHPPALRQERFEDRHVRRRRPRRPAAAARRPDRARNRPARPTSTSSPAKASCGGSIPVAPGITPGSGPGHLGLFGYDPLKYLIGRGALEATGIGFKLEPGDVAIRGNFCTLDADGHHHRPPRRPHRQRGKCAAGHQAATSQDPRRRSVRRAGEGAPLRGRLPRPGPRRQARRPRPRHRPASHRRRAARPGGRTTARARPRPRSPTSSSARRASCSPASRRPTASRSAASPPSPTCRATKKSTASAPRRSPSIRCTRASPGSWAWTSSAPPRRSTSRWTLLEENWSKYDFFFIHFKYTDSTGEDGNFAAKVKRIEEYDAAVPRIMALKPDVLIVTGDHSTPSMLKSHSWHPVPTLLWAKNCRTDAVPGLRRKRMPPRRPGAVRGEAPDDAGAGECGAAGEVRGVTTRQHA